MTSSTHKPRPPAVDDVWSAGGPLEVVDSPDEGDDGVGVVGDTEVRPPGVVELLHLTTVIALQGGRGHDSPPQAASTPLFHLLPPF